jgi:hypothetical protein
VTSQRNWDASIGNVEFKQVGGKIFQRSIYYLIDKALHHLLEWHTIKVQIENVSVFHVCVNSLIIPLLETLYCCNVVVMFVIDLYNLVFVNYCIPLVTNVINVWDR